MASSIVKSRNSLVFTRTPLRLSFAGGGTDLPAFYMQEPGMVLSTAIDKYVYVTVKNHGDLFDEPIRLNYSETELVERVDDIQNTIARECLRLVNTEPPVYINVISDVPSASGLGSSSSFAVGLLNALHAMQGERVSAGQLAKEASTVEMDMLGRPSGKQDQYAAAFGGLNLFRFLSDSSVSVDPQILEPTVLEELFDHILMFWTGITRDSSVVLSEQQANTNSKMSELVEMREHALSLKNIISNGFDPMRFGQVLDETWNLKRQLASKISSSVIDEWYSRAMSAGAYGGKLCGAGGGGFLLVLAPPSRHDSIRKALPDLRQLPVNHEAHGSTLLISV